MEQPSPTRTTPKLSIVVASSNARSTIEECLRAIHRQAPEGVEIIAADNSTDSTADIIRSRFPGLGLIRLPPSTLIPELWAAGILASRGEIASATSRTIVPAGTARLDPSGSVTFTWLMEIVGCWRPLCCSWPLGPPSLIRPWQLRWATFAWLANRSPPTLGLTSGELPPGEGW